MTNVILRTMYIDLAREIKQEVQSVSSIGLTHDIWTSSTTDSYGTFTAQYINQDWDMKVKVLQTRKLSGSHTGEAIAESFNQCKQEWGFRSQIVVTDNAANEQKAIDKLKWDSVRCMGHNINLEIRESLDVLEAARLVGKGRSVVKFFHKSALGSDILLKSRNLYWNLNMLDTN